MGHAFVLLASVVFGLTVPSYSYGPISRNPISVPQAPSENDGLKFLGSATDYGLISPLPTSSLASSTVPRYWWQQVRNPFVSEPCASGGDCQPSVVLHVPSLDQGKVSTASTAVAPYTGPLNLNTAPHPGCAAALRCVPDNYCTVEGVASDIPIVLTKDLYQLRVPLTDCQDPATGIIGKCCRDLNYKDPWPSDTDQEHENEQDTGNSLSTDYSYGAPSSFVTPLSSIYVNESPTSTETVIPISAFKPSTSVPKPVGDYGSGDSNSISPYPINSIPPYGQQPLSPDSNKPPPSSYPITSTPIPPNYPPQPSYPSHPPFSSKPPYPPQTFPSKPLHPSQTAQPTYITQSTNPTHPPYPPHPTQSGYPTQSIINNPQTTFYPLRPIYTFYPSTYPTQTSTQTTLIPSYKPPQSPSYPGSQKPPYPSQNYPNGIHNPPQQPNYPGHQPYPSSPTHQQQPNYPLQPSYPSSSEQQINYPWQQPYPPSSSPSQQPNYSSQQPTPSSPAVPLNPGYPSGASTTPQPYPSSSTTSPFPNYPTTLTPQTEKPHAVSSPFPPYQPGYPASGPSVTEKPYPSTTAPPTYPNSIPPQTEAPTKPSSPFPGYPSTGILQTEQPHLISNPPPPSTAYPPIGQQQGNPSFGGQGPHQPNFPGSQQPSYPTGPGNQASNYPSGPGNQQPSSPLSPGIQQPNYPTAPGSYPSTPGSQQPGYPGAGQQPNHPSISQQPNHPSLGSQPNYPGLGHHPGFGNHQPNNPITSQQPNYPSSGAPSQQPGHPSQPGLGQQPGHPSQPGLGQQPGHPSQPGYPGISQQPGYPGSGQQPGYPGSGQQPGYPGAGQQPGYPGSGQQPGYPGPGQQPGYPGSGQQPGYPGPGQQPGYPGPGQQPGYPGSGQQPGYPGPGQQPGYPGSGQQPGYPGLGQQPGYPGPGHQPGYPGPGQQPEYPGPGPQPGYPGPGPQPGYPGPSSQPQYPYPGPTYFYPYPDQPGVQVFISEVTSSTPIPPNSALYPLSSQQGAIVPNSQRPQVSIDPGVTPSILLKELSGPCGVKSDDGTPYGEAPWHAIVYSSKNKDLICGGAILSENAILTTAHCLDHSESDSTQIKVGPQGRIHHVQAIIRHSKYDPNTYNKDLALVFLKEPIRFGSHVGKICLPETSSQLESSDRECYVSTLAKELEPKTLKSIPIQVFSYKDCESKLKNTYLGKYFVLNDSFSCSSTPTDEELCLAKTGSPIACNKGDGTYELFGLKSWDLGCQEYKKSAIFSNVDIFWVRSMLGMPLTKLIANEQAYQRAKFRGETLEGVKIEQKPGFNQGYGK